MSFIFRMIFVFLAMNASMSNVWADEFDIERDDHKLHITAAYGLALTSTMIFERNSFSRWESVLYGSLVTAGVGLAKEYALDKEASEGDMVANGIGILLSAGVVFTFSL